MEQIGAQKKQKSVVELLRDAILSGSIPEETELTQNELAASLGVSRMPVREALILLEYQGLIRRLPNNHTRVVRLDEAYFKRLFDWAGGLELSLLLSVWGGQKKEGEALQASLGKTGDFHRYLREQCGHSFLERAWRQFTRSILVLRRAPAFMMRKQGCPVCVRPWRPPVWEMPVRQENVSPAIMRE